MIYFLLIVIIVLLFRILVRVNQVRKALTMQGRAKK